MERAEAERLGAMALFGEKYGEWVRMVEVDGVSRELCGGTHVANTAEIGIFKIASEGSSAANVRRIEALSGPVAIDWFREREERLREVGELLGSAQDPIAAARRAAERLAEAGKGEEREADRLVGELARDLVGQAAEVAGARIVIGSQQYIASPKQLLDLAKRIKAEVGGGECAIALGGFGGADDKVGIVILLSPGLVDRGLSAREIIGPAAAAIGGGGGGSPEMAQAGGKDSSKLGEALDIARRLFEQGLA
jgi:alanyl-tRNA synthetase